LNLFFQVLSKRADGYHEIASLYQAIDLFDRLFFTFSDRDSITCSDPNIPLDASNLIFIALALFRTHFPVVPPIQIHLEKNIPFQAGLGGGSSNAATTLWALNELTCRPATLSQLIEIGAKIGSDIPFFFSSGTAYCRGRGEILEPFSLPHPLTGYIAKPDFGLSTPLVYQNTRLEECTKSDPRDALKHLRFFNDLEVPSFRLEPRLIQLKTQLQKSFAQVTMTGSGTAFFCTCGKPTPIDGITFYPFHSTIRNGWYSYCPFATQSANL
jgi:4-diphosphocytidyl-2-C-methyl-D-erythritol kinase